MVSGISPLHLYPGTRPHYNTLTPGLLLNGSLSRVHEYQNTYSATDGFMHCRQVISIDDTHVYVKYDTKLLIDVAVDANGSIFPLAFAICANKSQKTWTLFLNYLKEHIVNQRSIICLISDRHGDILSSVQNLRAWQEPYAYHCYCVRHLKNNFQRAHPNKDLHDLMWMAVTDHQECKFRRQMELIKQEDQRAYTWLMRHELNKWTLHADSGRRWGILTTNVSESFNGLLKSAHGLPVTVIVRMSFKQMAERFVERSRGASSLTERGVEFIPIP
uniref:Uncharacterized protein LOC104214036 n=1 Tax=Nicotiana sylvestris TaxID=4096 RepID=A0A1U7V6B3_NICSY|nr:PREDICTED: uncharacterized protein LOC104214036 [Nicotiana sylvestris]